MCSGDAATTKAGAMAFAHPEISDDLLHRRRVPSVNMTMAADAAASDGLPIILISPRPSFVMNISMVPQHEGYGVNDVCRYDMRMASPNDEVGPCANTMVLMMSE